VLGDTIGFGDVDEPVSFGQYDGVAVHNSDREAWGTPIAHALLDVTVEGRDVGLSRRGARLRTRDRVTSETERERAE
jgi:hypothetical protein